MSENNNILGIGWSFPPTFSKIIQGVEMRRDEEDIVESLDILFHTRPGERLLRSDYGCDLRPLIFEGISKIIITKIRNQIKHSILLYEPRVDIEAINIDTTGYMNGQINIDIHLRVRATNSRFNKVYPYSIDQGTFVKA